MAHNTAIDRDRGAVYLAEDQIERILASRNRAVRLGRKVVVLPPQLTFGDLETVSDFIATALKHPRTAALYPAVGPVLVTARRGFRKASYVADPPDGGPAQIQIPAADSRGRWAMAQTVVLHELAHHLCAVTGHGQRFRSALEHLYLVHLGEDCAHLLARLFSPLADLPVISEQDGEDPALRRVGALLAKAAATDCAEEAQACLAKASTLAARHSVDLAVAALRSPGVATEPTHRMVTIGRPGEQMNRLLVSLFVRLAHDLGVAVDVGPRSVYVLAYGLAGDLDRLEAMYATASTVMVSGADSHARSQHWRGQLYVAPDKSGRTALRPVTARVARNAYCIGFVDRVTARGANRATTTQDFNRAAQTVASDALETGAAQTIAAQKITAQQTAQTVALALRHKDLVVSQYHRAATRARGRWQGTSSGAGSATQSRRAGEAAAEQFGRSRLTGNDRKQLQS